MLTRNKRASPTDMVLLLIMLFFLAVSMFIALYANTKMQEIISTTVLNESAAYDSINSSFEYVNSFVVQRGVVLFFAILCIGIMVSSFLVRAHPIFLFIYIITLGVTIFVSMYLANAYEMVVTNATLSAVASKYTMVTFIMQHVAKILLAVGAMSFVILFGKIGGGGSSGSASSDI